jgi:energy-coupling factor transporter transmembrane protein EcfT
MADGLGILYTDYIFIPLVTLVPFIVAVFFLIQHKSWAKVILGVLLLIFSLYFTYAFFIEPGAPMADQIWGRS